MFDFVFNLSFKIPIISSIVFFVVFLIIMIRAIKVGTSKKNTENNGEINLFKILLHSVFSKKLKKEEDVTCAYCGSDLPVGTKKVPKCSASIKKQNTIKRINFKFKKMH